MQCICIDLKSFYASVECVERGLEPLNTNLVVADESRTEKTICLAVTPSLKRYGIPGRPRLFEVIQKVREINEERLRNEPYHEFTDSSCYASELDRDPSLKLDFIIAPPQMAHYMKVSTKIYEIYLRYIAPEDIHVYSIDEVFIDVTGYLNTYHCTAHELAIKLIRDVLKETGITATAGIGTNLYLAKIAMDIVAKKMPADEDGVRIAELDEMSFRDKLWDHTPITDFWRISTGNANRLAKLGLYTMGDIARYSESGEDELFKAFGVNAELIIDHAWGYEPCPISAIKSYKPKSRSLSQGQVLSCPYTFDKGRIIVREMTELLVLDLVRKGLVTDQIVLTVGYDHTGIPGDYNGELKTDRYGKKIPKQAHGSINLGRQTSSTKIIVEKAMELYDRIVDDKLLVRRMYVVANHIVPASEAKEEVLQYSLFDDVEALERQREQEETALKREHSLQEAMLHIKDRFGKNAILKGLNFQEGATTRERNGQVGGHKA
ncbi:MAG: DNA methylase [Ruminococcus sp.]|nr:DNA methylase [Ruminococcus sp.]